MAPDGGTGRPDLMGIVRTAAAVMLMAMPAGAFYLAPRPLTLSILVLAAVVLSLFGGLLLPGLKSSRSERILFAVLLAAFYFWVGSYLQQIQPYPFSISWSEGNHLWNAALFFTSGTGNPTGEIPFSNYVTPGLYGLRGLPFLFGNGHIMVYRAWEATLWLAPSLLFAWVISKISNLQGRHAWLFTLWGTLFLAQGPVYAPLLLGGAVSLLATRSSREWVQRAGMLFGTLLAGLARWTWMFTPGLWAIMALRFRSRDESSRQPHWGALSLDALAVLAGAGLSQLFSYLLTGHVPLTYLATLSHPLLWYRLLPNDTYTPGILIGLVLTTGPLLVALFMTGWHTRDSLNLWDTGLTVLLTAGLALAGLVISVKIGGGSNLHNLDMFLATLVLLAGLWAVRGMEEMNAARPRVLGSTWILALLAMPVAQVVGRVERLSLPDADVTRDALAVIDGLLQSAAMDEEVLFIDQRQLLVFGDYPSLRWDPQFEQVELMDRALASDEDYLNDFYAQLYAQRYRWVLCDPQPVVFKGRSGPFGEENDAWVAAVTIPLLETYQVRYMLDDVGIWIMEPRSEGVSDGTH